MKAKATHYAKVTVFLVMFATLIAVAGANASGRVNWCRAIVAAASNPT